ncbi:MFS transporter [Streptosporangium vulgare]|uniref:MFS transporter n=1 Tax=Streptosporangium vulgare TaxID=46190 RepID=A0ABV5T6R5_9ACTN
MPVVNIWLYGSAGGGAGMAGGRTLGRRFGWLWAAYVVSSYGTSFGFGAFPLIAVLVLHSGPAQVSALSAVGPAVGAVLAVPLGPWMEFRRKRPVMMAMDLTRFVALLSIPVAFALGRLGFAQLLVVSVVVTAAKIAFGAAGGAYLKSLLPPEDLLVANSRFESTTWSATVVGPPLGGAAIGMFGPVATVTADAVSYLLSALCVRAIGAGEPRPARADAPRRDADAPRQGADAPRRDSGAPPRPRAGRTVGAGVFRPRAGRPARAGDLFEGWRRILAHRTLRRLFLNTILVNGLIMATEPLLAVLLLGRLGFAPWQYGLVFALPCVGGLVGARLARGLVARFGQHGVMLTAGALRACWPVGLAFVQPGVPGIVLVIVVQFGLVTCCGLFNPVLATYRLDHTDPGGVARTLSAWSVSGSLAIAALTALWGLLAAVTSPRAAIATAGVLLLATPLLLPRRERAAGGGRRGTQGLVHR